MRTLSIIACLLIAEASCYNNFFRFLQTDPTSTVIPFNDTLPCGTCIKQGYVFCVEGTEHSEVVDPALKPRAKCCEAVGSCLEQDDAAWNCSTTYSDTTYALYMCPFEKNNCGQGEITFNKTGENVNQAVTLYPGDVCFYTVHSNCGLPSFQPSTIDDEVTIETIEFDDDEVSDDTTTAQQGTPGASGATAQTQTPTQGVKMPPKVKDFAPTYAPNQTDGNWTKWLGSFGPDMMKPKNESLPPLDNQTWVWLPIQNETNVNWIPMPMLNGSTPQWIPIKNGTSFVPPKNDSSVEWVPVESGEHVFWVPKVNGTMPGWMIKNGTQEVNFLPQMDGNYTKPPPDNDNATKPMPDFNWDKPCKPKPKQNPLCKMVFDNGTVECLNGTKRIVPLDNQQANTAGGSQLPPPPPAGNQTSDNQTIPQQIQELNFTQFGFPPQFNISECNMTLPELQDGDEWCPEYIFDWQGGYELNKTKEGEPVVTVQEQFAGPKKQAYDMNQGGIKKYKEDYQNNDQQGTSRNKTEDLCKGRNQLIAMTDTRTPSASLRFLSTTEPKTFQMTMMSVSFADALSSNSANLMAALIISFALALHNLF